MREFYVLCIRPKLAPWVLSGPAAMSRRACEDAIRWQTQGGYDDARWEICILAGDGRFFLNAAGEFFHPERGPYTVEAWAEICDRIGYRAADKALVTLRADLARILAGIYGEANGGEDRPPEGDDFNDLWDAVNAALTRGGVEPI